MAIQGFYRKGQEYVAVKQIRLSSSDILTIGEKVPSKKYPLKEFHLRSLFKRAQIGHPDTPWAEAMLAARTPIEEPEVKVEVEVKPAPKVKAKAKAKPKVKAPAKPSWEK